MSDTLRRRRNLASEEEALRPLVQLLEVLGQMVRISPQYLAGYASSGAGTPMSLSSEAAARIASNFR